jgi:hypothetical protein
LKRQKRTTTTMKKRTTMAWVAAAAFSAATAQATTYTGDLILGFSSGTGNDFLYDLGPESGLSYGQQWNLGSALSGFNLNTVNWGVIGDKNVSGTRVAWTTTPGGMVPNTVPNNATWLTLDTPARSIFQNFAAAGAGQTLTIAATDDNSWNKQTISGTLSTQYVNAYENPNGVGFAALSFFDVFADASTPGLQGWFSLDQTGTVTYVPEPTTLNLLAGAGLLALVVRRRFGR